MRWATYASTGTALVLILAKAVAWWLTESLSLLGSLMDSALDLLASLVNLLAVRHALAPADREHRFGHGKAEALAALAQSTFVAGSAVFLVLEAAARIAHPQPVARPMIGIAVMVFSIVLTLLLVVFQSWVVRRTGSAAVRADRLHYKSDLLMNTGVIAAVALAHWGWPG
ncbi:MAG: cation diffusion facilitator family transporter, partial [Zetaproteobacteria bacterium]